MEFAGLAANQTPLTATELNPGLTPAALLPLADLTPLNGSASRLVFVDAGVAGYEDLVAGIGNDREVYLLNPAQDAIQQITQTLLGRSGISSLEIISHGADGALKLGADWLSFENLGQYSPQIQSWAQAMTDDGDILLYGCNVAQSQRGLAFLQALSQLTQADIAASNNFTGNAAIGGDWDLEVNVGAVDRRQSFVTDRAPVFFGLLAPELVSRVATSGDSTGGSITGSQAISADGKAIVFSTTADNLIDPATIGIADGNGREDVFVYDRLNQVAQIVSVAFLDPAAPAGTIRQTGNGASSGAVISADGNYVAFLSRATNLLATPIPAAEAVQNVYFYDRVSTKLTLITVRDNLAGVRGDSSALSISPDGRYVAFVNTGTDLFDTSDGNAAADVFVWDRDAAATAKPITPISLKGDLSGTGNGISGKPVVSGPNAAGFYSVAFVSSASDLVAGDSANQDVFVRTLDAALTLERVSQRNAATQPNNSSDNPTISADGNRIAFTSSASNLVATDANNAQDIFVWTRGAATPVQLVSANPAGASGLVASTGGGIGGTTSADDSKNPVISADGKYVAFDSGATDLVAGDTNAKRDVFLRDLTAGTTQLVSQTATGVGGDGNSSNPTIATTATGVTVGFSSAAENLTTTDGNNATDVFIRPIVGTTGTTTLISKDVTQPFSAVGASSLPLLSRDGSVITFSSLAATLTADQDANGAIDLFATSVATPSVKLLTKRAPGLPANTGNNASTIGNPRNVISDNGQFTVFTSRASNLASGDANGPTIDIFRRDLGTGQITLISAGTTGATGANNDSSNAVINGDGTVIAFTSTASNLVTGDTNGVQDAFVWDSTNTTPLRRISAAIPGATASTVQDISANGRVVFVTGNPTVQDVNGPVGDIYLWNPTTPDSVTLVAKTGSGEAAISKDGRFIVFSSTASTLTTGDTNGVSDIFRYDVATGTTTLISKPTTGVSNGRSLNPTISADGQIVAFVSDATNLTANADTNGGSDVFVWRAATGAVELASVTPGGTSATLAVGGTGLSGSFRPSVSADGKFVVFTSSGSDLVAADGNANRLDVFIRSLGATPTTSLLSAPAGAGASGNGDADNAVISGDGRYVSFTSTSSNLSARDTNGAIQDVFLVDRQTNLLRLLSVDQTDTGSGNQASKSPAIDRGGNFISFETSASNLVIGDFNGASDIVGTTVRPTVNLDLIDATAAETSATPDIGVYKITRSDATEAVTLRLTVANTSTVSAADYTLTSSVPTVTIASATPDTYDITIPANVATVNLNVTAFNDAIAEAAELLQLRLEPGTTYTARNLSTGSITIAANDTGVTQLGDSGEGSLRQAILNANASPGTDTITFDLPGTGQAPRTINLITALPTITDPIDLDATFQSGFVGGNPVVDINGAAIGAPANGLTINSSGSSIRGLKIRGFQGNGIAITGNNNQIGNASNSLHGNLITGNTGDGVAVISGTGNRITANQISTNGGLGINLGTDQVTPNDLGDADTGANNLQNFPVLTIAEPTATGSTVQGTLNGLPSTVYQIELFRSIAATAAAAEGETFLTSTSVTTDATGNGRFTATIATVNSGLILATATDPAGNTSEFSSPLSIGTPTVAIVAPTPASIPEGNTGTTPATFRITLSQPSSQPTTVTYSTQNGTAIGGEDFTAITNGTAVIPAGASFIDVVVNITGDALFEPNETFSVNLLSVTPNASLVPTATTSTALVTIANDDAQPLPAVTITPVTPTIGEAAGNASFNVTLSRAPTQATTVQYRTVAGTATAGSDFTATTGTVTFAAGATTLTQVITVPIINDTIREPNETFTVELLDTLTNAVLGTARTATGVIVDDGDAQPTIGITPLSARKLEGNTGTTAFTFNVALSGASGETVTVNYATADGTAVSTGATADFTAASGTLTFAPGGPLTQTVTVLVNGDTIDEPLEQFTIGLSTPVNATIAPTAISALGQILPDDPFAEPIVTVERPTPPTVTEGNGGAAADNTVQFVIKLDRPAVDRVLVNYETQDGTAKASDRDYIGQSGTILIPAGADRQVITVAVRGDLKPEADETFSLALLSATNASLGATTTAAVTILNDDQPPTPTIVLSPIVPTSQTELAAVTNPFQFRVELLNAPTTPITVDYTTVNGTATAGQDFVAKAGKLTFDSNSGTIQVITIDGLDDTIAEPTEAFTLQLSNPTTGVTITGNNASVTILDNDTTTPPPPTPPTPPPSGIAPAIVLSAIVPTSQTELAAATTPFQFRAELLNAPANGSPITVDYTTVNGTATAGQDYVAKTGKLTFDGTTGTIQVISVLGLDDTTIEPDETFTLQLSNPTTGTTITGNNASVTILDNDTPLPPPPPPILPPPPPPILPPPPPVIPPTPPVTPPTPRPAGDAPIAGVDGKVDLFWRNAATGSNVIWRTDRTPAFNRVDLPQTTPQEWQRGAVADFDNDGDSDILWHNQATGATLIWVMNGEQIQTASILPTLPGAWEIQRVADLTNDGAKDIIWRNKATGENLVWQMNGINFGSQIALPTAADRDWQLRGIADFNQDNQLDLVWRNQRTGENGVWLMNGTQLAQIVFLPSADTNWELGAVADFNRDGKPDLLWQNRQTGTALIWTMNGTALASGNIIGTVPDTNWKIVDTTDFNRDGNIDIIWRNSQSGENAVWYMQGNAFGIGVFLPTTTPGRELSGIGDFNGDGNPDFAWHSQTSGETFLWRSGGGSPYARGLALPSVASPAWQVVSSGDFNGDGTSDLFWLNSATRETMVWLLGKGQPIGVIPGPTVTDSGWKVGGAADFDRDGDADLFWYNTRTGDTGLWEMQGGNYVRAITTPPNVRDSGWQVEGIRDFDRDGTPDILWRNTRTGANGIWKMKGLAYDRAIDLPIVDLKWEILGIGDFSGDRSPDILWRNVTSQEMVIWPLDGTVYAPDKVVKLPSFLNSQWVVRGVRDFNQDGFEDILWYNQATGTERLWYMNNGQFGASVGLLPVGDPNWQLEGVDNFGTV